MYLAESWQISIFIGVSHFKGVTNGAAVAFLMFTSVSVLNLEERGLVES